MICINSQEKNFSFQKRGYLDQKKQKICQEPLHKTTKPFHYKLLLNHKDLNILTSSLLITTQKEQKEKTIQQRQLLLTKFLKIYSEIDGHDSVSSILKNRVAYLRLNPFSIHPQDESFVMLKTLWDADSSIGNFSYVVIFFVESASLLFANMGKKQCNGRIKPGNSCKINASDSERGKYIRLQGKKGNFGEKREKEHTKTVIYKNKGFLIQPKAGKITQYTV